MCWTYIIKSCKISQSQMCFLSHSFSNENSPFCWEPVWEAREINLMFCSEAGLFLDLVQNVSTISSPDKYGSLSLLFSSMRCSRRDREADKQFDRQVVKQLDRQIYRQQNRKTVKQLGKCTDRPVHWGIEAGKQDNENPFITMRISMISDVTAKLLPSVIFWSRICLD